MTDKAEDFRQAMSRFASGVAVVTSRRDGEINGMTATAVTSVSLEPPLVLVCVDHKNYSRELIKASRAFALNILSDKQKELSDAFAEPGRDKAKLLAGLPTKTAVTGAPIIEDCLAYVDCRVVDQVEAGDHTVFVAEVKAAGIRDAGLPLVWYHAHYSRLAAEQHD